MSNKRTPIGSVIHSTWTALNIRCANGKYKQLQTQVKCKTYSNINIELTRVEFKEYCLQNKDYILSLKRPSIDRIDKSKGYSIDNIQFIELAYNIAKDKTVFTDTHGTCSICKDYKSIDDFCKDKRRNNGKSTTCKSCERNRSAKRKLKLTLNNL